MADALTTFLNQATDLREYKRALAVQLVNLGIDYGLVKEALQVSGPFISKWRRVYREKGVNGFRMGYKGSKSRLTADQREATIAWLKNQASWDLYGLQRYLKNQYGVVYQSLQSYYGLMHMAGLKWKKGQSRSVQKKKS